MKWVDERVYIYGGAEESGVDGNVSEWMGEKRGRSDKWSGFFLGVDYLMIRYLVLLRCRRSGLACLGWNRFGEA